MGSCSTKSKKEKIVHIEKPNKNEKDKADAPPESSINVDPPIETPLASPDDPNNSKMDDTFMTSVSTSGDGEEEEIHTIIHPRDPILERGLAAPEDDRPLLISDKLPSGPQYSYAVSSTCGMRNTMEDVHSLVPDADRFFPKDMKFPTPHSYFAIFDGHAGVECAKHAADEEEGVLANLAMDPIGYQNDISRRFKEAFTTTDNTFLDICKSHHENGLYGYRAGCTAVCALIAGNELVLANLGDSRAVLVHNDKVYRMTEDHKPRDEKETERIEAAGGRVLFGRVNGVLGVSRALGDIEFKEANASSDFLVSREPDITRFQLSDLSQVLILACDGLWDVVSDIDVAQLCQKRLFEGRTSQELADELVKYAIDHSSSDNVSVVVIVFNTTPSPGQPGGPPLPAGAVESDK